ncbi:MAG: nucleotidyltransferase domain-containing protein [Bacillota bacterium]|jgi:predicted nucleotidyltransferase
MKPSDSINRNHNIKNIAPSVLKNIHGYLSQQREVVALYLFGSFGTEFQNEFSDLDLGVVFQPRELPGLRRELSLEAELSLIMGIDKIDLVNLNRAPIQLRFKAVADGTILYEADPDTLSDFLEDTYRFHSDYQIDLKAYYHEYRKALREAYLNG